MGGGEHLSSRAGGDSPRRSVDSTSVPTTRYARSGDVNIAYQVVGDGPRDLVYVPGWVSNIEVMWEDPGLERFLEGLTAFSRLILFDKRGTGMSDAVSIDHLPTLEQRMDDVRAVMDAVGSERATVMGHSEGGSMCILFSATYPERTEKLILIGCYAVRSWSEDYPWAPRAEEREREIEATERTWGDPDAIPEWVAPSRIHDQAFRTWFARYLRLSASPKAAVQLLRTNTQIDTRSILPSIQVPTLCLYRAGDRDVRVEEGRWLASRIPNAHLVELPGADHFLGSDDGGAMLGEIEEFMTGQSAWREPDRVLATVLFTDIVGSTERLAAMGDHAWRDVLKRHHAVIRSLVERHRGRSIGTSGDGALAAFDGPARAIRAAQAIREGLHPLGIEIRAGLHTGEVEVMGDDISGMAVHIGARVAALAGPGEVLVSRTVRDLVSGSGFEFEDRGIHALKGIPEPWQVYAVR
jgi:pimeloyl-ACP methyl ester carboxylesterase/class 3 adenylate cyclase